MESLWDQASTAEPVSVEELFSVFERFVEALKIEELTSVALSRELDTCHERAKACIDGLRELPHTLKAQHITLQVLSLGMRFGLASGLSLYLHQSPLGNYPFSDSSALAGDSRKLGDRMREMLVRADQEWRSTHIDDLHLLFGYGKKCNLSTLDEAAEALDKAGDSSEKFQSFLLATVKGGFALGLCQAALLYLSKEKPRESL